MDRMASPTVRPCDVITSTRATACPRSPQGCVSSSAWILLVSSADITDGAGFRRQANAHNVREHLRKDGSRLFLEGTVRALHDGQDEPTAFIKVGQDVTAR